MLDHVDFAVCDFGRSRLFYEAALLPLGLVPVVAFDEGEGRIGVGFGRDGVGCLFIGGGPPVAGRLHLALQAPSRPAVEAFHRAAIAAGGICHGPPGLRERYGPNYFAAYVKDPDGHVIEAVCRTAT
ncbi:glyoxalase/bleomycin resistance/extradiol dioxygenase family protein [Ahniella affigens]|uniref:Glyoxalase/bleomycin resistance/extradiol dioxygenase family protein n=2 Tax=Ahniella affigens TaxID=2021234 RepID=A0A2P1PZ74_9GAMM|nr:glyoxalase/bleomycin resistance/extradiol dioxygenase family protein [Ahniella affigens]